MPSKAANALICTMRALSKALDDRKLPCILPGFNTKLLLLWSPTQEPFHGCEAKCYGIGSVLQLESKLSGI